MATMPNNFFENILKQRYLDQEFARKERAKWRRLRDENLIYPIQMHGWDYKTGYKKQYTEYVDATVYMKHLLKMDNELDWVDV